MSYLPVPSEQELKSYEMIARVAANNKYWKKVGGDGPIETVVPTILSVMLLGREIGISPIQAISGGIHNVNGKFELSSRMMNQLIRKHGHQINIKSLTNNMCHLIGKRKDTQETAEVYFTIEEAVRCGLVRSGSVWEKLPQDMLFARALSRLARRLFPDCIGGCYVEGEINEKIETIESIPLMEEPRDLLEADLSLPEDCDKERVDLFLEETAEVTKRPLSLLKKEATLRMDSFITAFRKWETGKFPAVVNA